MYANNYGPASPQPGLSNNPFVGDPATAHARFPDLTVSNPQLGYPSSGYPSQPQQYQQHYAQHPAQPYTPGAPYQAQPQLMSPQSQFASTSYTPQYPAQGRMTQPPAFQPTGGFPQPLPQQYPIPSGYPYSSGYPTQPANATPTYLAEFDPYAQQSQSQSPLGQTRIGQGPTGAGPQGVAHPRDAIRMHKFGLEAWDTYSWKQLFGACDALKEAWSVRKQQAEDIVRQYGGLADPGLFSPDPAFGYNTQVEGWKQVLKDAIDNFDTVVASTFQLHEVFNSYRQSGDQASKRRVRESCNAAVKGLPDWPSN